MLTAQAKKSCEAFLGAPIADERIAAITKSLAAQMQNVVLIGMPGSGKTTIGTRLAAQLGRTFLDADTVLEQKAGMNIPEIFGLRVRMASGSGRRRCWRSWASAPGWSSLWAAAA